LFHASEFENFNRSAPLVFQIHAVVAAIERREVKGAVPDALDVHFLQAGDDLLQFKRKPLTVAGAGQLRADALGLPRRWPGGPFRILNAELFARRVRIA
jgi:hypothetical protein